jgi:hypothetical protein
LPPRQGVEKIRRVSGERVVEFLRACDERGAGNEKKKEIPSMFPQTNKQTNQQTKKKKLVQEANLATLRKTEQKINRRTSKDHHKEW